MVHLQNQGLSIHKIGKRLLELRVIRDKVWRNTNPLAKNHDAHGEAISMLVKNLTLSCVLQASECHKTKYAGTEACFTKIITIRHMILINLNGRENLHRGEELQHPKRPSFGYQSQRRTHSPQ
ncbi:unnamed protein product [Lepeophtheirus salmonis]|uniref:(salmon louse) hypothetical protein n=1 Tax=Lepeophtheirus salmonis TaxID=72036 RepID=A0A7R8HD65_LEPSM|nr:unnamed protein product [Lepeophtheirus salmonis]CAF3028233.1 unnamed protein product [Lepeophtheirus salmonis]